MDTYRGRSLIFIWWLIILMMGSVSHAQTPPNIRVSSLTSTNGITNYTRLLLGTNGWPDEGVSLTNLFLFSTHAASNSTIPFIYFNRFQDKMSGGDPNARVFGFTEELLEGTNFNGQVAQAIRGFTGLPSTNVNNTNLVYDHSGIVGVYGVNTFFKLDNSASGESAGIVGADYSSHRVKFGTIGISAPINTNQVLVGGASVALGDLSAHGSTYVGHYAEAASINNNPQVVPWTNAVLLLENRAHSNNIPFIIAGSTPSLSGTRTVEFSVHDGGHTTAGSVTNNGVYKHPTGAFVGAVFTSQDALGNAVWTNSLTVTNFVVGTNSVEGSLWTNDTVVLKPKDIGLLTNFALRGGVTSNNSVFPFGDFASHYWSSTNVGKFSIAWGTNVMAGGRASVAFGDNNFVGTNTFASTIAGGSNNVIANSAQTAFIGGGIVNSNAASLSTIGGGQANTIRSGATFSAIVGGQDNRVEASVPHAFIGGGSGNSIRNSLTPSSFGVIAGGVNNSVLDNPHGAIVGGQENVARGQGGFVGGGFHNLMLDSSSLYNVTVGGTSNNLGVGSAYCVIVGGKENGTSSINSFIGGGFTNAIDSVSPHTVIVGGLRNTINTGTGSSILGGTSNHVTAAYATIIGNQLSNSLARSVDIGEGQTTKTTFTGTNVTFRSGISVGPTPAYITNILVGSATLDFGSTGAGLTNDLPITVTSTTTNDFPQLCIPFQAIANGGVFFPFMSNDTVWVRFVNPSGTAIDPPQAVFRAMVTKTR